MDVPRDFQLLDDDDNNFNGNISNYNNSLNINTSTNPIASSLNIHSANNLQISTENSKSPKLINKYNISPNRPNPNSQIELKPIERRRVHSPLKLRGIEDYIQSYASNSNNFQQQSKITMNLRMDDLLANVKNESSYQTLSDFSVMTGEQENHNNVFNNKNNNDDLDLEDDENNEDDNENLKYKYTATYKIDETTGSFQEQSKTIFENKTKPLRPPVPPPPKFATTTPLMVRSSENDLNNNNNIMSSVVSDFTNVYENNENNSYNNHNNNNNENLSNEQHDNSYEPSHSAQTQLALALEALKNNSKKLESKLDKIDDITISSTQYYDVINDSNVTDVPTTLTSSENNNETKKKNDSFFTEFLNKSDDLLVQTQLKLERLSKLESVNKPLAPIPPSPEPQPKPKPVPSVIIPDKPSSNMSIPSFTTSQQINNSKSLIDLKSSENKTKIESKTNEPIITPAQPNQIDLLFDLSSDSQMEFNTEPLKVGHSYFDLIGLGNDQTSNIEKNDLNKSSVALKDLAELEIKNEDTELNHVVNVLNKVDEIDTPNVKSPPTLNLKNSSSLDKIEENIEEPVILKPINQNNIDEQENQAPSIDILITEPINEKDDNNIVPDGFFNLKHEIPKDGYGVSRPTSPSPSIKSTNSECNNKTQTIGNNLTPALTPNEEIKTILDENKLAENKKNINNSSSNIDEISMDFFIGGAVEQINNVTKEDVKTLITSNSTFKKYSRPTSPANMPSPSIARARPKPSSRSVSPSFNSSQNDLSQVGFSISSYQTPTLNRKKERKKVYSSSSANQTEAESSSSSEEDEKFQIKIGEKNKTINITNSFVPLLARPPQSAEEIEHFRQRRLSSDTASITRSIKDDSSEDEVAVVNEVSLKNNETEETNTSKRKESIQSEFNLELPDEDDSLPLTDFNDKFEIKQYADGSYGCLVLVRQPFRSANIMYKNALQKFTEVRTWTECFVKLIDSPPNGKKLLFYNAHELLALAATADTTIDKIIDIVTTNNIVKEIKNPLNDSNSANTNNEEADTEDSIKIKKIPPFHEIELKASYKFSELQLQQYDTYTKIHTFKLQDIIFKETLQIRPDRIMALPERFLKKFTKTKVTSLLDHTPIPFEICKFAHLSHSHLQAFLLLLQDAFWKLPTLTRKLQREQQLEQLKQQPTTTQSISAVAASIFSLGTNKQIQTASLNSVTTHTREQVTIKSVDEYKCKLDKDCRIKEHRSRTRIFIINFLNDAEPVIEVGLNDCLRHGKEIVGRRDIIPIKTEQWISPELFELNENVIDKEEFEKTHCLRCVNMPDNLMVEIMRYRTRPRRNYELPLQVRCYMNMVNRRVEIRCECTVSGSYYTSSDVHCADIQIRFPIPDVWVYLFRVQKTFHYGAVHSTKHKFGKIKGLDRFLVHKSSQSQGAMMEASCGKAKYEQAFRSLVWRIEQLPTKNKDIYKTHLLICKFNLQEYDALPEQYEPISKVQYQVATICASSKSQVRSISVNPCDEPPEKWVKLKSKFDYDLEINYSFDTNELPAVDKENCAELQHISQTESEGDNNEDEDNDD